MKIFSNITIKSIQLDNPVYGIFFLTFQNLLPVYFKPSKFRYTNCCHHHLFTNRKDCLKLLKHLLSRLKEEDPSFDKFYSYQAKTTLLHACCSRTQDTEWKASELSQCFLQLLEDFLGHLKKGVLPNFFIPNQNLLAAPGQRKCDSLVRRIKVERDNGFPIFR